MATVTAQILVDLDGSGAYATDITAYCWRSSNDPNAPTGDVAFNLLGLGRRGSLDAADASTLDFALDNRTGRFSPQNGSSPYASGGVNLFRPYILVKATITYNAVTYNVFKGVITSISARPQRTDQTAYVTATDLFFLLARTEVRRPLMRSQYTGVILHRLLDDVEGAEGREGIANPRFETNLTGWTQSGTATLTRVVGGDKNLEGPASCEVLTAAAASGARNTSTDKASEKWTLVAYCKPKTDDDIGKQVRVSMVDNVGTIANGPFTVMADRDHWTRLEVSGTYNASASQYLDVTALLSGVQFVIGAAHAVPYVNAIARDIDDGQTVVPYFPDGQGALEYRGKALEAVERVRRLEMLALFYFDGSGTAIFEDRHYRWRESRCLTAQSTFDERGVLEYSEHGDDRIKSVKVDYPTFILGTAGSVLATRESVIPLIPGRTTVVEWDYDGGAADTVITPVANTDYFVNSAADGSGTDQSGSATMTFENFGGGARQTFLNTSSRTIYVLPDSQVRGTPIRAEPDTATYTDAGGPALAADYPTLEGPNEVVSQAVAEYIGIRYSDQQERMAATHSAAFPEAALTSDMAAILARRVSDRVVYTNDTLPFSLKITDRAYYIDSIDLKCTGESMEWNARLSPVDADYWIIGTSLLGIDTVLAA